MCMCTSNLSRIPLTGHKENRILISGSNHFRNTAIAGTGTGNLPAIGAFAYSLEGGTYRLQIVLADLLFPERVHLFGFLYHTGLIRVI